MIFKSIRLKEGFFERAIIFSEGVNLIHSEKNSCGKTTLLRFMLYALGYNIPNTRKIKFDRCEVELVIECETVGEILLLRHSDIAIEATVKDQKRTFVLPEQQNDLHTIIFGTENVDILGNLLGAFYVDQEKGWTLLNRGVVIGSIHFKIEELIRGLSDCDCSELIRKEAQLSREMTKYKQMFSVAQYRETLDQEAGELVTDSYEEESDVTVNQLLLRKKRLKSELRRIDNTLSDNRRFKKFVADMKLLVQAPDGSTFPVTENNIVGLNDAIDLLIATEELDVAVEEDLSQKKMENIPKWPDGILDYLDETERNKVLEYACNLQISQSTRLHKMLVQYKKDIADYKSKLKEAQSRPCYNPRHNKPENEPAFFKEMSDECMSRAIAILDTVFKSIESLGGSINSDLSVKIRDDIVRFRMVESQDQVKHEMTKQEAQELVKYNDDIKNHRWASKPQIRKYDKVYNGKLRIEFGERSYIRDNDSEKLEDRLGDILVTLYEKAEENRIVREAREEAERKRVEEARCREENRQRKEQEIRLVKELVNKAEDYRIAKEIREYIQAMIDSGNEDITPEWIEWALKKADWYDPSIETEDEYLGKRQHEKSAEEKEKSLQDSIRKSWYW